MSLTRKGLITSNKILSHRVTTQALLFFLVELLFVPSLAWQICLKNYSILFSRSESLLVLARRLSTEHEWNRNLADFSFFPLFLSKALWSQPAAAAWSYKTELKLKKKRAEVIFLIMEKLETSMCIWKDGIRRQTTTTAFIVDVNSIVFVFIVALLLAFFQ